MGGIRQLLLFTAKTIPRYETAALRKAAIFKYHTAIPEA
jgi:hypothetical protein